MNTVQEWSSILTVTVVPVTCMPHGGALQCHRDGTHPGNLPFHRDGNELVITVNNISTHSDSLDLCTSRSDPSARLRVPPLVILLHLLRPS